MSGAAIGHSGKPRWVWRAVAGLQALSSFDRRSSPTVTALAPNLAVLMLGWPVLEGAGAALIMPAIVALVASNFGRDQRPRAYGLVASAGAIAVAAGPATLGS